MTGLRKRLGLAGLAAALLAVAPPAWAEPKTHLVEIEGMKFNPKVLEVSPGDTVIFRNADLVPHTATAKDFDSKPINPSGSWKLVVGKKKGEIPYKCSLHPTMSGFLTVK